MLFFNWVYWAGLLTTAFAFWQMRNPRQRQALLVCTSLTALVILQPLATAIQLVMVMGAYFLAKRKSNALFVAILLALLTTLILWKRVTLFQADLFMNSSMAYVFGLSFLIFRVIAYLIDVRRGQITDHSLTRYLLYIFFLPTFAAGPLDRFDSITALKPKRPDRHDFGQIARRLLFGFFKKLVVVELLISNILVPGLGEPSSRLTAWTYLLIVFLHAYFDLSAYTDIAIASSRLFGVRPCENFDAPLFQTSISSFWRHWHMSLTTWCRDYIYFPVLGLFRRTELSIIATMLVIGLWHDAGLSRLIWALAHAVALLVVLHWQKLKIRVPAFLGWAATLAFVTLSYSFAATPDVSRALAVIKIALFGGRL